MQVKEKIILKLCKTFGFILKKINEKRTNLSERTNLWGEIYLLSNYLRFTQRLQIVIHV